LVFYPLHSIFLTYLFSGFKAIPIFSTALLFLCLGRILYQLHRLFSSVQNAHLNFYRHHGLVSYSHIIFLYNIASLASLPTSAATLSTDLLNSASRFTVASATPYCLPISSAVFNFSSFCTKVKSVLAPCRFLRQFASSYHFDNLIFYYLHSVFLTNFFSCIARWVKITHRRPCQPLG